MSQVGLPEGPRGPAMLIADRLSMELDYGGGVEFRHQASDLIPEQPCTGVSVLPTPCQSTWTSDISMRPPMVWVLYPRAMASRRGEMHPQPHAPISVTTQVLSELMTTHHLKLTNTTEIPQYFQLLVSRPFSVSQEGASRSRRAPGPGREQGCEEDPAKASKQLVLHPQENMLVSWEVRCRQSLGPEVTFLSHICRHVQTCAHYPHALVQTFASRHCTLSCHPLPELQ